ncbi:MAG TPA: tetratricopeptide repeat protein [Xanthomonadaceae bacterium]|nr:tetratricopeptide repeat protein [Xanthomonadaceae bacterium]HRX99483.1 tetratricopeptide repeat protein [Xanthomonadaceae bacterium]
MAMEILDEHEQSERVRKWLHENGTAIIGGIALGLILIFGYQWWTRSKIEHRLTAATQYLSVDAAVEQKDRDGLDRIAGELADKYADTPYAAMALMQVAKEQVAAGQRDEATATLQRAHDIAVDESLKGIIGLRLARLKLASGDADGAIAMAAGKEVAVFEALAAELRGDALLSKGDADGAREAYSAALTHLDASAPNRRIVEMKLADLGGEADDTSES